MNTFFNLTLSGPCRPARTLALSAILKLVLLSVAGPGHGSDDFGWSGQYRYLASTDAPARDGLIAAEYLIRVGPDPDDCIIRVVNADAQETIHCRQASRHSESLALTFQSFDGDQLENRLGVQIYRPGEVLLTLTRTGEGRQTEWNAMPSAPDGASKGRFFTRDQNI